MAEPLKNHYNQRFVSNLSGYLGQFIPDFEEQKFESLIFSGEWESLELKARINRLAVVLNMFLPNRYENAVPVLLDITEAIRAKHGKEQDYFYMFLPTYIEKYGMSHFDLSIQALERITLLVSAEFAVRPFILQDPVKMMAQMYAWSSHSDPRVRRLASEGCRPSLPWAPKLPMFQKDPSPILHVLENLKNDESIYVRKSVANNLNDISKYHPGLVVSLAEKWMGKSVHTDWIIRQGCRTLVKQSNPAVLDIFGLSSEHPIDILNLIKSVPDVTIGEVLEFGFELHVKSESAVKLRISYLIDFVKSSGKRSSKLFHIAESHYSHGKYNFSKSLRFADLTTRKHYPGRHTLSIAVNGKRLKAIDFEVVS